ncbi:MAG: sugar transferase [Marinirhabdus sp.]
MYKTIIKPHADILVSIIAFLILSPLFLVTAVVLAAVNKGNPFFVQKRPGKNGTIFKIIKFKTMTDTRDANGALLPDGKRLTRFGQFVRSASLDEIPQLLNVIKGDMSLVGPRPLLPEYLVLYSTFQKRRHEVKPGITGYAQVNGRNTLSWDKKFELDVYYVDNRTFAMDFMILLKTVQKVIMRSGINNEKATTMAPFMGNLKNE